jgi:pyridoxal phosphate enzyme (YggS family)
VLDPQQVAANLALVRERVGEAVEILAATKYVTADELPALREAGITLVGENRSDAMVEKQALHDDLFTWDFIGHLQSRKVRDIVGRVRLIHAVDSLSACRQIHERATTTASCLLQVNLAGEASKAGVAAGEVDAFLEQVAPLDRLRFEGLMTMPPLTDDPDAARPWFAGLRDLRDRLEPAWRGRHRFEQLSMGTSQDYQVAAQEGATIVRVGSVLYGR